MSFLFPNVLFFLFSLSIPIVIHLFNFRRYRRIDFTNVRLLKDIEIKSKSTKTLKNLLILLCRLLAMTFLILAFAQPFIPLEKNEKSTSGNAALFYIDNSFSMDEGNSGNSMLDAAKESALQTAAAFGNSKHLYLMTNEFSQADFNALTYEEFKTSVQKISVNLHSRNYIDLVNRINAIQAQGNNSGISAYAYSDFQISQFGSFDVALDSSVNLNLVHIQSPASSNISIDSCYLSNPILTVEGIDSIMVKVSNYSDEALVNHALRFYVNDKQLALQSFNLDAWSSKVISIPYKENERGNFACRIEVGDNGIKEDDALFFSFRIDSALVVYNLGGDEANKYFKAVYSSPFIFNYAKEGNADIGIIGQSSMYLLNMQSDFSSGLISEVRKNVAQGKNLVLYFEDHKNEEQFNKILKELNLENFAAFDTSNFAISQPNYQSIILKNAVEKVPQNPNYPQTKGHFKLSNRVNRSKEIVMKLENGDPALLSYPLEKGAVFVFTFGLNSDESTFGLNAFFVPVSINMAYASQHAGKLYHTIGTDELIHVIPSSSAKEAVLHITGENTDVIPEFKRIDGQDYLRIHNQILQSGNFELLSNDMPLGNISFNYTRMESDIRKYAEPELSEIITGAGKNNVTLISASADKISSSAILTTQARTLWKYCVILALMFFVTELMIIKLMNS